jgi:hypothetical protein
MSLLWIKVASGDGRSARQIDDEFSEDDTHLHPGEDFHDAHEIAAEWLGVHPNDVRYTLEHHPVSAFPHRGVHNFESDDQDHVRQMTRHIHSGGHLPPGVAVDIPQSSWNPAGKEPVTIIDGNHRAAAHADAGSETMPLWVGRAK